MTTAAATKLSQLPEANPWVSQWEFGDGVWGGML